MAMLDICLPSGGDPASADMLSIFLSLGGVGVGVFGGAGREETAVVVDYGVCVWICVVCGGGACANGRQV